jgi:hypothetical protein
MVEQVTKAGVTFASLAEFLGVRVLTVYMGTAVCVLVVGGLTIYAGYRFYKHLKKAKKEI